MTCAARRVVANALALVALGLASCGGDDKGDEATTTPSPPAETPGDSGAAPSPSQLPPGFVECMADKGYEVESPTDIHAAPPEVLQECFGH